MDLDLYSLDERNKNKVQVYDVSMARQKEYRVVYCSGLLEKKFPVQMKEDPIFSFSVPTECPGVPADILDTRSTWADPDAYDKAALDLAARFQKNFKEFEADASPEIKAAGPSVK